MSCDRDTETRPAARHDPFRMSADFSELTDSERKELLDLMDEAYTNLPDNNGPEEGQTE